MSRSQPADPASSEMPVRRCRRAGQCRARPGAQAGRVRARLKSFLLATPLLAVLLLSFGVPIALLLMRAVYDPSIADALPRTSEALRNWDGAGPPGDPAFAALADDLKEKQAGALR